MGELRGRELECTARSWFSNGYALLLDGRSVGEMRGRWFSQRLDVRLVTRRRLLMEHRGLLGGKFELREGTRSVGQAQRRGAFRPVWELRLSGGESARMQARG